MSTSPIPVKHLYSDFYTNLNDHPINNDVALKVNENAVKQALKNLLLTNRGERLFQPNIGGNILGMLFEHMAPQTVVSMKEKIESTIKTYEPRVELIDVVVSPVYSQNLVNITVVFRLVNREEQVSLEIVLNRVR